MQQEHERLWLVEQQRGRQLPGVQHPVLVYPDLEDVWEIFWALSARRPVHLAGAGAIPYGEILAYFRLHQIPRWQWDRILWGIDILEHAWHEKIRERQEAQQKANDHAGTRSHTPRPTSRANG